MLILSIHYDYYKILADMFVQNDLKLSRTLYDEEWDLLFCSHIMI